jgi:plasmid maintenance system antidote protein VapI
MPSLRYSFVNERDEQIGLNFVVRLPDSDVQEEADGTQYVQVDNLLACLHRVTKKTGLSLYAFYDEEHQAWAPVQSTDECCVVLNGVIKVLVRHTPADAAAAEEDSAVAATDTTKTKKKKRSARTKTYGEMFAMLRRADRLRAVYSSQNEVARAMSVHPSTLRSWYKTRKTLTEAGIAEKDVATMQLCIGIPKFGHSGTTNVSEDSDTAKE